VWQASHVYDFEEMLFVESGGNHRGSVVFLGLVDPNHLSAAYIFSQTVHQDDFLTYLGQRMILEGKHDQSAIVGIPVILQVDGQSWTRGDAQTAAFALLSVQYRKGGYGVADGDGTVGTGSLAGIAGDLLDTLNYSNRTFHHLLSGRKSRGCFQFCQ
jgi:hypothetical protein